MRLSQQVTADGLLFAKLKHSNEHTNGILLKFVSGTVNYGAPGAAVIPLLADPLPLILPTTNTKSLELSGGGVVAVGLF